MKRIVEVMKNRMRSNFTKAAGCLVLVASITQVYAANLNLPRDGWASWQVPAVDNAPSWCCFGDDWRTPDNVRKTCQLDEKDYGYGTRGRDETTDQIRVYAKFSAGKLERLRALSASCAANATTPIQNIAGVTADESAAWLLEVVTREGGGETTTHKAGEGRRISGDALAALATHRGNAARGHRHGDRRRSVAAVHPG